MVRENQNKWGVVIIACMAIFTLLLRAPAGMITVNFPSVELNDPPAAPIVFVAGLPTGVPVPVMAG